jgi:hypothetical protein
MMSTAEAQMGVKKIALQNVDGRGADPKSRDAGPDAGIFDPERTRRKKAVDFARASIELEGFRLGEDVEVLVQRFVDGEIEIADLVSSELSRIKDRQPS